MKKHLLFLAFGLLVSIPFTGNAGYYKQQTAATDVEYTPQGQESYYHANAPWYGSPHNRQGYHRNYHSRVQKRNDGWQNGWRTSKANPRNWTRSGRWGKQHAHYYGAQDTPTATSAYHTH